MLQYFFFNISNYFSSTLYKMLKHFHPTFFWRLLPTFFRNIWTFFRSVPIYFRNVGFLNYFSSTFLRNVATFCEMLQHFAKCWTNLCCIFFLRWRISAHGVQRSVSPHARPQCVEPWRQRWPHALGLCAAGGGRRRRPEPVGWSAPKETEAGQRGAGPHECVQQRAGEGGREGCRGRS
jgi:hypothetical protein